MNSLDDNTVALTLPAGFLPLTAYATAIAAIFRFLVLEAVCDSLLDLLNI
jgi:hypothetical protein